MGFRQTKSEAHLELKEWLDWIDRHRPELKAIGLPAEVFQDGTCWNDFLENGHLHWHESSGFEFGELTCGQLSALHRFLEREYGADEAGPKLLGWIRVRLGVDEFRINAGSKT